jgi:N-acetylglutamate synthase-like GNAT family acetyltransferase
MVAMPYSYPLIRQATSADLPELKALVQLSVRRLQTRDYSPAQIESALTYIYHIDTQLILDGTYFVAEIEGVIAGCGGWSKRRALYNGDEKHGAAPLRDPRTDPAVIRAMFTHPDYARRGIAREIMDMAEVGAWRAGFTRLELVATLTGVPLYRQCGFHEVEAFAVPMPNGESLPAVRMAKAIE